MLGQTIQSPLLSLSDWTPPHLKYLNNTYDLVLDLILSLLWHPAHDVLPTPNKGAQPASLNHPVQPKRPSTPELNGVLIDVSSPYRRRK